MLEKAPSTLVIWSLWLNSEGPSIKSGSEFREHREYHQTDNSVNMWARTLPSMASLYLSQLMMHCPCDWPWTIHSSVSPPCGLVATIAVGVQALWFAIALCLTNQGILETYPQHVELCIKDLCGSAFCQLSASSHQSPKLSL